MRHREAIEIGADDHTANFRHAPELGYRQKRFLDPLQHVLRPHDIERRVGERQAKDVALSELDIVQTFLTGPFYYYVLILFALLGLAMWRITQSPFGLHLRAIRENASKAAYVGVQIFRMRLAAFVISAVYGGIGGTILAVTTGLADPELAYWTHSGNLVFMAVLGGSGTFAGPAIGALAFVLLQDFVMSITQYWRFVMGAVLVLLVVFMPQGLSGTIDALVRRKGGR